MGEGGVPPISTNRFEPVARVTLHLADKETSKAQFCSAQRVACQMALRVDSYRKTFTGTPRKDNLRRPKKKKKGGGEGVTLARVTPSHCRDESPQTGTPYGSLGRSRNGTRSRYHVWLNDGGLINPSPSERFGLFFFNRFSLNT